MNDLDILIGKTIISVVLDDNDGEITFTTADRVYVFSTDAECCSETWINSIDNVEALINNEVMFVSGREMEYDKQKHGFVGKSNTERVLVYTYDIITKKGACTIDFRNDSNGYYGGSLTLARDYAREGKIATSVDESEKNKQERNQKVEDNFAAVVVGMQRLQKVFKDKMLIDIDRAHEELRAATLKQNDIVMKELVDFYTKNRQPEEWGK